MIRAIFFDLDGTLFDRERAWAACVEDFLDRRADAIGPGRRAGLLLETMKLVSDPMFERERLGRHLALELPELGMGRGAIAAQLAGRLPRFIEPDPDVLAMLADLSGRYRLAILTNGSRRVQQPKLDRAGLVGAVGRVFISGALGTRKPNPAIFRAALGWAGVEPGDALMVGDSLWEDIHGGRRAGLRTCRVGRLPCRARVRPDWEIRRVVDLPGLLR